MKPENARVPPGVSPADRSRFGRALWLFGDSLFRGQALGRFPDAMTDEQADKEPLWPFRSPPAMINLFVSDANSLTFDDTAAPVEGDFVAAFGGGTGFPNDTKEGVLSVERGLETGLIRPGDTLAFLDAGGHCGDPDRHEAAWRAIVRAANATALPAFFCTAFDKLAEYESPTVGRTPKELCMHNLAWRGGRSHNDALRAAVAGEGVFGSTRLLEMNDVIEDCHRRLEAAYGMPAFRPDKLHLNVWGQMRLSWVLYSVAWPDLAARTVPRSAEILCRSQWQRLGNQAEKHSGWGGRTAVEIARLCTSFVAEDMKIPAVNVT